MGGVNINKKSKLILIGYFSIIGIIVNAYIIDFLSAILNKSTYSFDINIFKIYLNMFSNAMLVKLLIGIVLLEIVGVWSLLDNDKTYKSRMVKITPDIETPAPAGQKQCGSAKWMDKSMYPETLNSFILDSRELEDGVDYIEQGGLVIGKEDLKDGRERIYYIADDIHSETIGATRSGKTRCLVLESIGCIGLSGESMVLPDIKGELYDYTAPFLLQRGYDNYVIDFDNPKKSMRWNYLQPTIDCIDEGDIPGAIDAVWDLTSQLVGEAKGEKIWNDGEASTIAAGIMSVVYDNRSPENHIYRNLTNVYYFLSEMCTPVENVMPINVYKETLPDNHPAKGLFAVANIAPSRTRGSFYTAALMTLKLFTNPYIYDMTCRSDFDPADLGRRKSALFIIVPDDRKTYHPLVSLLCDQVEMILSKEAKACGGRLKVRVNNMYEEFGNFPKRQNFINNLTVNGGKGIRYNLFIQDFAQMEDLYEKTGQRTINNNCDNWIYLKCKDPETLKTISDKLDDYTVSTYSLSENNNSGSQGSSSSGHNVSFMGRKLLLPGEVAKIKRPYSLYIGDDDPAIMYAPDLSKWQFNKLFGMGDKKHNIKLRMERSAARPEREIGMDIPLWGIWKNYQEAIKKKAAEKAAEKAAVGMEE